ncbi:MAG: CDC27 family protein [Syntrophales bacterium]|nr:CDC27 family protein [Syntrophales bacterium]MDD5641290.1 CDC27 family protein [Syntrophales bacterium]
MTDHGVSLDRLKERLEREPCAGAMHLLAEAYYQQGLYPQAVEASRRALSLYPENPELRLILGQSLVPLGKLAEAEEVLKPVVQEIGRLGEVFDTLRRLYEGQGRREDADRAAELYRLLKGPLLQLLAGEAGPGASLPGAGRERQRLLAIKTLEVLEKWQGALQSR